MSDAATTTHPIVLLIDRQEMVGEAIRRMLADEADIEYHYCQDPLHAVSKANDVHPTTILLDLDSGQPDMGSYALLKAFRVNPFTSDTPIIVLSLQDDPNAKSRAFEMGASDYLVKLPDGIEMIARIRAHSKTYLLHLMREQEFLEMKKQVNNLKSAVGLGAANNSV